MNQTEELKTALDLLSALEEPVRSTDWMVEIGAWDGIHKSNIAAPVLSKRSRGLFLEADPVRFESLKRNYDSEKNARCVKALVGSPGSELSVILRNQEIEHVKFISIDIDGADIHLVTELDYQSTDILCVEFNPSIPTFLCYEQPKGSTVMHGSSYRSIKAAVEAAGFTVVDVVNYNVIAVSSRFGIKVDNLVSEIVNELLEVRSDIPYLAFGFDRSLLSGSATVKDSRRGFIVKIDNLNPIPKILQKMPSKYNFLERAILFFYKLWNRRTDLMHGRKSGVAR